jgi:hypothetical protein
MPLPLPLILTLTLFLPQCYPCRARAKKRSADEGGTGEL